MADNKRLRKEKDRLTAIAGALVDALKEEKRLQADNNRLCNEKEGLSAILALGGSVLVASVLFMIRIGWIKEHCACNSPQ